MSDFHHYRTKPVQVQAMQWLVPDGQEVGNGSDIIRWVLAHGGTARYHDASEHPRGQMLHVETYHSTTKAEPGDYVVKDAWDQFDVCDEITFRARYEEVQR